MAAVKPDGWDLDTMSIAPARLLGGERRLTILGLAITGFTVLFLASRVSGNVGFVPMSFVVVAAGLAFYAVWMGLLLTIWRIDPWLSKTLPRFLSHPKYMPAHSTGAASAEKRRALRSKGLQR